jgi:hypothetical protein
MSQLLNRGNQNELAVKLRWKYTQARCESRDFPMPLGVGLYALS